MTVRVTTLFELTKTGWSETWYYAGGLPGDGRIPAIYSDLAQLRARLLGAPAKVIGLKMSDIRRRKGTISPKQEVTINTDQLVEVGPLSWLAELTFAGGDLRRQIWLRGCPDDAVQFDAVQLRQVPSDDFLGLFRQWRDALRASGAQVRRVVSIDDAVAGDKADVSAVVPDPAIIRTQLTTNNPMPDTTQPLIVSGFRAPLSRLNGTYAPNVGWSQVGLNITIRGKAISLAAANGYPGGGHVRMARYSYDTFLSGELVFARTRRVGRAFFVPAGRRPHR